MIVCSCLFLSAVRCCSLCIVVRRLWWFVIRWLLFDGCCVLCVVRCLVFVVY